MKSIPRRGGRWLVAASSTLLLVFLGLLYYQQVRGNRTQFVPDARLIEELQRATILEEEAPAPGAGWPQWRGPRRDGSAAAQELATDWPPEGPRRLWSKAAGEGYAGFAVVGNRAWTLFREKEREVIVCWQADSGRELWRHAYDCRFANDYGSGPRATPAVSGGKVYTLGAAGLLHCLDAERGTVLWKHDLLAEFGAPLPQWGCAWSPLVEGNLVFTSPGGTKGNALAAFHKDTGALAWKAEDDPAGYSSPLAVTVDPVRQILFFTGSSLVAVTPDRGHLLWRHAWPTFAAVNAATPLFFRAQGGEGTLYYVLISSGYGKGCALLKIEPTGSGGFRARPVYEGTQLRNHFASSVLWQDHVYGFDETNLVCLDVKSGTTQWKQAGFQKGSLIVADGSLIVLGENGKLALAEATPAQYREKVSFRPFRGQRCWTPPVLAEGLLFVRDEAQAVCYDLRGK
jgi:outer membrane protein assembly factor BamB